MAVVTASNLRKEIAGSLLFEGVSFSVERRDRLSLSGPNGAGKTTLLRMLTGESDVHGGELAFAKGTRIALHDQRPPLDRGLTLREYALTGARDLIETEEELRALEQAMAGGDHSPRTLHRYAAAQARLEHAGGYTWRDRAASALRGLGFAEDDLDRPLETFSGGELTRASLARSLAGDPDLLVLDEPTNHLDLESREALETALDAFPGTILLVSHDRALLDAVAHRLLAIEDGSLRSFDEGWAEYARRRQEPQPTPAPPPRNEQPKPKPRRERPPRPSELERLEGRISEQEQAVAELERRLADDWSDVETLAAHRQARNELQSLISRWERLFEEAQA